MRSSYLKADLSAHRVPLRANTNELGVGDCLRQFSNCGDLMIPKLKRKDVASERICVPAK